jgi:hypothetical protein
MRSGATAESLTRLHEVAAQARPVALAREQILPVLEPLQTLFPDGLRRGSTVGIERSTSLALALAAGPSGEGSWLAVIGVSSLGLAAASELGVDLEHLVAVADPPSASWGTVVATLVDAFDVVLLRPRRRIGVADTRRLTARARERGSVLVVLGATATWPDAVDVELTIRSEQWHGIGDGHGHLHARQVIVEAGGRRAAARTRRVSLWLPAAGGGVAAVDELAEVRPFRVPPNVGSIVGL